MQCVCGFACGFAATAAQPQSHSVRTGTLLQEKNNFLGRSSSACRYNIKKTRGRGNAKPLPNNA